MSRGQKGKKLRN